jgi:membrane-bound serine protease (ClpP class)
VIGLHVEITHPGRSRPGRRRISLLLFMLSTQILPVNWVGVCLIVGGLVMFLLESRDGHGGRSPRGIVWVVGSMILSRRPDLPGSAPPAC